MADFLRQQIFRSQHENDNKKDNFDKDMINNFEKESANIESITTKSLEQIQNQYVPSDQQKQQNEFSNNILNSFLKTVKSENVFTGQTVEQTQVIRQSIATETKKDPNIHDAQYELMEQFGVKGNEHKVRKIRRKLGQSDINYKPIDAKKAEQDVFENAKNQADKYNLLHKPVQQANPKFAIPEGHHGQYKDPYEIYAGEDMSVLKYIDETVDPENRALYTRNSVKRNVVYAKEQQPQEEIDTHSKIQHRPANPTTNTNGHLAEMFYARPEYEENMNLGQSLHTTVKNTYTNPQFNININTDNDYTNYTKSDATVQYSMYSSMQPSTRENIEDNVQYYQNLNRLQGRNQNNYINDSFAANDNEDTYINNHAQVDTAKNIQNINYNYNEYEYDNLNDIQDIRDMKSNYPKVVQNIQPKEYEALYNDVNEGRLYNNFTKAEQKVQQSLSQNEYYNLQNNFIDKTIDYGQRESKNHDVKYNLVNGEQNMQYNNDLDKMYQYTNLNTINKNNDNMNRQQYFDAVDTNNDNNMSKVQNNVQYNLNPEQFNVQNLEYDHIQQTHNTGNTQMYQEGMQQLVGQQYTAESDIIFVPRAHQLTPGLPQQEQYQYYDSTNEDTYLAKMNDTTFDAHPNYYNRSKKVTYNSLNDQHLNSPMIKNTSRPNIFNSNTIVTGMINSSKKRF